MVSDLNIKNKTKTERQRILNKNLRISHDYFNFMEKILYFFLERLFLKVSKFLKYLTCPNLSFSPKFVYGRLFVFKVCVFWNSMGLS